jgi:hypothetical protein
MYVAYILKIYFAVFQVSTEGRVGNDRLWTRDLKPCIIR